MKPADRRLPGLRGRGLRRDIFVTAAVAAALSLAALTAACGGSSGGTPAAGGQAGVPTAMQVLYKVQRGDLVQTAFGQVKVVAAKAKPVVVATVPAQNAAAVAAGQTATVMLFPAAPTARAASRRAARAARPSRRVASVAAISPGAARPAR